MKQHQVIPEEHLTDKSSNNFSSQESESDLKAKNF